MSNKCRLFLGIGFFLFFFCASAHAGDDGVSATASVDRAVALIGDRVRLEIDVKYRAGTRIDFPEFRDDRIGDFEIKDSGNELKKEIFGGFSLRHWYYIAAYSTGKHEIPPIEIKYKKKSAAEWKIIHTRALNISVGSVLPKSKMPADIKDVKGPMSYFEINWLIISGILIILFIITGSIIYIFRKKPAPVKLPHETALEELEAARGNFSKNSDIKEYYTGISDCVRRYIERLFKLKAPEMTTEEFLGSLREATILSLDQKDLLKAFLNACDLVKFAKYTPARQEMESVFAAARKFIEDTKEIFMPKTDNGRRA